MHLKLWRDVLNLLTESLDINRINTWLKPLEVYPSNDETSLILRAPDTFFVDFIEQQYKQKILSAATQCNQNIKSVQIISNKHEPIIEYENIEPKKTDIKKDIQPEQQKQKHNRLNPLYTFDLFVVGSGNQFAKSVAFAVAEAPGTTKFNPLLIYSGVGLGKTHLLHAIGNYAKMNHKDCKVTYVTSEEFYFNFIDAIKNNTTKAFTERFRKSDLLLVDDIQFFSGKESTQEQFFYVFNTLYQSEKQIVLTSDMPPASLQGLQDRLISRFQWGLCVDIQPPDLETRVAIIKKKAEKDNLIFPEDVLYFIAENVSSNIRELEGVIIKLLAYSSISKIDITIDSVKAVLKQNLQKHTPTRVSIDQIIEKVADYYNVGVDMIREKNRRKEVAHCRQVAMFISKTNTQHSLKTIGLHFGGRDHSTVIHAIKQIESLIKNDLTVAHDVNQIISELE